MNYSELSPIWIINTLSEEEGKQFEERISQQLLAYSQNEIGYSFDSAKQRWWKIDRVSNFDVELIDDHKHPNDIPAYSLTENKLDETYLLVVILGNISEFDSANNIVTELKRAKENAAFMLGSGIKVNYYGLFAFEKGQKINSLLEVKIRDSDFDSIFLQGTNNNTNENSHGYHILKKEDNSYNFWDLSVQIIHHLILTRGRLNYFNDTKLHVVGASSIIFEPEGEKHLCANKLTKDIVQKFKTDNSGAHWNEKKIIDLSDSFTDFHGWKNIYNELRGGYEDLPTDNLHMPSKVSPWSLFLRILIPEYFKKYIKSVVRLIHENVTSFSFVTTERYKNHLENKYSELTGDNRHVKAIEEELCNIWDRKKNEEKDCAIGLQQFKSKLDEMKEFLESQKKSIKDLTEQTAPDSKRISFPEKHDYPLGGFGDKYQQRSDEYIEKGDGGKSGDSILQKLTRVLQFHPVPLSLMVRSILLGILLPMCVLTILKLVPDFILNTAAIESQPGSIYLIVGCFVLCVLISFTQYLFLVVDNIRVKIRDYIAWSLYKLQLQTYRMTLEKAEKYFDSAIKVCEAVEKRVKDFIESTQGLENANQHKYYYNSFQLNVMGDYEGNIILKDDSIDYRYPVWAPSGKQAVSVINKTDDLYFKVFRDVLIMSDNATLDILKDLLFDFDTSKDFLLFDTALRDAIKKNLGIYVHSTLISNLSELLFDTGKNKADGNNNMAIHPENGYEDSVAKYIRVKSYPSGDVIVGAYHYVSYIIPQSNAYKEPSWDSLFNWSHRLSDTSGLFTISILQGFSINSLRDVKDIDIIENDGQINEGADNNGKQNNKEM